MARIQSMARIESMARIQSIAGIESMARIQSSYEMTVDIHLKGHTICIRIGMGTY